MSEYKYTVKDMQKMSVEQLEEVALISIENKDWYPYEPLYLQDKVALLHLLYQKSPEKYTQLMQRIIKQYPGGACNWIAVYCSYGNSYSTFPDFDKIIERQSDVSDKFLSIRKVLSGSEKHDRISLCTLFDYSPAARTIIKEKRIDLSPENRIYYLQHFSFTRNTWLNIPYLTSIRQLLEIGWKLPEAFMGYLNPAPGCNIDIDPGAIQVLVEENPEEALKFLSMDYFTACYPFDMHPSYKKLAYEKWIEFLYRYCNVKDYRFIEEGINHKLNKIKELCISILEEKDNSEISRTRFEKKLDTAGLLDKELLLQNAPDKKTEKIRTKLLIKLFISGYSYTAKDFKNIYMENAVNRPLASTLYWGFYQNNQLIRVFTLNENGIPVDENGSVIEWDEKYTVRLIYPLELSSALLKQLSGNIKEKKIKQPFPQLNISYKDLSPNEIKGKTVKRYEGTVINQGSLTLGATKWNFENVDTQTLVCYHLTDPIQLLGVQLCFDLIWKGCEYAQDQVCLRDMYFYRLPMSGKPYEQIVPETAILHPDEVPIRFRSTALAIFDKITKLK